ncbi:hypothetical protein LR48_Vigan08g069900 [Vigna angularis]|uniref:Uncharacterized protein n=1 Tax=Phaseolus angularis TaxID=3914 RepID=A0A0L9V4I7_PHAAN|nr:hypothetical protein LR48_Vigan08g069900 [Vigna angularis]
MLAGCNSDKNLTIWALNSTKVISTTGGNLTQAWIKVNFGKLPDNLKSTTTTIAATTLSIEKIRPPPQQWQQQPSLSERRTKLDDVFQQFLQVSISTQKSIEASCKRMEMQIGHMIQKLDDVGVITEDNPRKECQAIITGSDKTLDEKKIERKEKEELSEKDKDVVEKEREVVEREERKKICMKIEKGWPPHRARDSRLQCSKERRRNQINPIPASSFPVSMSNTSSLSKITWQEEQAQARRAGATEALVMEEDDEDDDFEDAEEGEEEDSDDSMS